MKRAMSDEAGRSIALERYLGSRLLPLAILVAAALSLGAPLAFLEIRLRELAAHADTTARAVAERLRREAAEHPTLWRYDTLRLVPHLRAHEHGPDVERIEVTGRDGQPLGLGAGEDLARLRGLDLLWGSAPIVVDDEALGEVWVAVSASRARRDALLLLGPFSLLGVALGVLLYGIPLRAARRAERRIEGLVAELDRSTRALADRGEDLEREIAARSTELRAANADLQAQQARLRDLSMRSVALAEEERRAIARDLHDSAGQSLTAIRIHLQLVGERAGGVDGVMPLVEQALGMTDATLEEIRRAVRTLGPAILDEIGLGEALARYCDDFAERTRIHVEHHGCAVPRPLSAAVESACYRIAQEALTNVARHAAASHVEVRLAVEAASLSLEIVDDGRGFTPGAPRPAGAAGGHGLVGMRERAELLGGTLDVASTPGEGTRVRVEIPL